MGEAKQRMAAFLKAHPRCCFCGGEEPATTEDHQPGRVFFRNRQWPEGFVFPACGPCNAASREAENLASIVIDSSAPGDRSKYQSRVRSVRHNYPGVIPSLLDISANDKRRALRNLKLNLPPGLTHAEMPMVKIDPQLWNPYFRLVGQKIMLALHYQTFGTPLPRTGRVWLATLTNGEDLDQEWFQFVRDTTGRFVVPTRSQKSLLDQFSLQWDAMDDPRVGMYLVTLQKRMIFIGLTTEQPDRHALSDVGELMGPLSHGVS